MITIIDNNIKLADAWIELINSIAELKKIENKIYNILKLQEKCKEFNKCNSDNTKLYEEIISLKEENKKLNITENIKELYGQRRQQIKLMKITLSLIDTLKININEEDNNE